MINAAVCGLGRTGKEVIKALAENDKIDVAAAFCRPGSEKAGKDIGLISNIDETGIKAVELTQAESVLRTQEIDVVIDFSNPEGTKTLLTACRKYGVPVVVCTTGFTDEEVAWMSKLALNKKMGIVYAPNVTLGINVLLSLIKTVTHVLPYFDYQVTETHHCRKLDRPSGTAKRIAETIEDELEDSDEHVPINSVRAGGYVGVHEVLAAGDFERISLVHESFSRKAFVQGAIEAAKFILNRKGWFSMEDVVDINSILSAEHYENNQVSSGV